MKAILNLTTQPCTAAQKQQGAVDAPRYMRGLLQFEAIPSTYELKKRAEQVASATKIAGYACAMIGGAPFFVEPLCHALRELGIEPIFPFSKKEKRSSAQVIHRHLGWVPAA